MDEKTKKLVMERFDALPKSVQEVITSSNYQDTLIEIGKQFGLNVEQMGSLELETTLVMMGLNPVKDFEADLTRELNVEKEKGSQIVKDINEKVFLKIRDLLKLMNTPAGEEPDLEETEAPTQSIAVETQTTNKDEDENTQILNTAGIEIVPEKLEIAGAVKPTVPSSNPAIPPKPSILEQKLSAPVKTEAVKTEHSLNNLT